MVTGATLEEVDFEAIADGLYDYAIWPHDRPYIDINQVALYVRQITILNKKGLKLYSFGPVNSYNLATQIVAVLVEMGLLLLATGKFGGRYYARCLN